MVGGEAAADAIATARRLDRLRVGLHMVLVDGKPVLAPERLPDLVDASGRLRTDLPRLGLEICARPAVRAQVRAEIEAQFRGYLATGLPLDHVNAHKHFHLHPVVGSEIIAIGRRYGMRGLRVPCEPAAVLARLEPGAAPAPAYVSPWIRLLRRRVRRHGLRATDQVFGLAWSGALSAARLAGLLRQLPTGTTEIYLHPGTRDGFPGSAPGYRYGDELAALTDPDVVALTRRTDLTLGGYADF